MVRGYEEGYLAQGERVNRFEVQGAGDFLDVMMGEVSSPWHFYIQQCTEVVSAQSLQERKERYQRGASFFTRLSLVE